ncbi:MAG: bifunctional DNA-formamidopyrimidine glycosylase/DNA-(apurinic or apyrimidinic site) lyase [Dehalococcoidia bacterium]|nr:bifunctional DNA-formamidopyrimidine glycosylase/DNA-(apurinic or apyrimidinic site) lyase [Dehalococcoidia bacterium]
MPELPEVETIKNELSPLAVGRTIVSVEFLWEKTLLSPDISEFARRVNGRKVVSLDRRGKYLVWRLDSGDSLLVHLRMTGSFFIGDGSSPDPSHTRAIVHFDGGLKAYFIDPRKFGKFQLVSDDGWMCGKLGVEPLSDEFTAEVLTLLLEGKKAPVKAVLLRQDLIAGVGNMYADEALYEAGIRPARLADGLTSIEIIRLHGAIREVLRRAVASGGASISNYFRPDGARGHAHEGFKVAHRRGGTCYCCGGPVERIVVCQRGTYFCPACQR